MKTELMEQKNKFIRKVKPIIIIIITVIILISIITVIIVIIIIIISVIVITTVNEKVVKEDMFKYSTTKLGKAMEKVKKF